MVGGGIDRCVDGVLSSEGDEDGCNAEEKKTTSFESVAYRSSNASSSSKNGLCVENGLLSPEVVCDDVGL